jgi:hypothetical protein
MTAAYRLKGVGWLIAAVGIALGFYLVSLRVAEERKRLEAVNGRIAAAQRDIRALETEFDTRANLVQLEKWNGDTLALAAPTAGQFVRDAGQLAAIDVNAAAGAAPVQTAALLVPSIVSAPAAAAVPATPASQAVAVAKPAPVPAAAPVRMAAVRSPAPAGHAGTSHVAASHAAASHVAEAAVVRVVAYHAAPPPLPARALAHLATGDRSVRAAAKARPQAVAMLDDKLLSDATLGDLIAKAKREARHEGAHSR